MAAEHLNKQREQAIFVTVIEGDDGGNFSSHLVRKHGVPEQIWNFLLVPGIKCIDPPRDPKEEDGVPGWIAAGTPARTMVGKWFAAHVWTSKGNFARMWKQEMSEEVAAALIPEGEVWYMETCVPATYDVDVLGQKTYVH
jgi:hypothetical protein